MHEMAPNLPCVHQYGGDDGFSQSYLPGFSVPFARLLIWAETAPGRSNYHPRHVIAPRPCTIAPRPRTFGPDRSNYRAPDSGRARR